jgi:hypothetical protein
MLHLLIINKNEDSVGCTVEIQDLPLEYMKSSFATCPDVSIAKGTETDIMSIFM